MKFKYLLFLLLFPGITFAEVMSGTYNQAESYQFCLRTKGSPEVFKTNAVCSAASTGDVNLICDGAAQAEATNCFVDEGTCYSVALTAAEKKCRVLSVAVVDQDGTDWIDKDLEITQNISAPTGTCTAGSTTTCTLAVGSNSTDNYYKGIPLAGIAGTGADQTSCICSYNGSTRVATFCKTLPTAFDATTEYAISLIPCETVSPTAGEIADAAAAVFFSGNTGSDSGDAVAGSVVYEIINAIGAGGDTPPRRD